MEQEIYPVESDVPNNRAQLELNDLLVRMCDLVNDITAIDEAKEVSKYVFKYNCRLLYTRHDINLMRSVEDQVLSWLIDVCHELDPITVHDNYVKALDRMENMLRNERVCFSLGCLRFILRTHAVMLENISQFDVWMMFGLVKMVITEKDEILARLP